jgi:hypothetical protein
MFRLAGPFQDHVTNPFVPTAALQAKPMAPEAARSSTMESGFSGLLGHTLGIAVLGTITDAQESELEAVKQLWPQAPHQVCQFHGLRDASEPAFDADRKVKTAMRKQLQRKVREVRKHLKRDIPQVPKAEAEQLSVLDDYALGTLTALNRDGITPFDFAAVQAASDLDELADSLQRLEKKGQM